MPRPTYQDYVEDARLPSGGPEPRPDMLAVLVSGQNPDGTDFTLPVSGSVAATSTSTPAAPAAAVAVTWGAAIAVGANRMLAIGVPAAVGAGAIDVTVSIGGLAYMSGIAVPVNPALALPITHAAADQGLFVIVPPGSSVKITHAGTPGATVAYYSLSF